MTYVKLNSDTTDFGELEADNLLVGASFGLDAFAVGAFYGNILSAERRCLEDLDGDDAYGLGAVRPRRRRHGQRRRRARPTTVVGRRRRGRRDHRRLRYQDGVLIPNNGTVRGKGGLRPAFFFWVRPPAGRDRRRRVRLPTPLASRPPGPDRTAAMPLADIRARIAAAAAARRPARRTRSRSSPSPSSSRPSGCARCSTPASASSARTGCRRPRAAGRRSAPSFPGVELHLVGPLQSNKLARALELFDAIHSLDRDSLARKLADAVQARGACPTLFVQVNTGREPQKAGVDPDGLDAFLAACRGSYGLPVFGLMAIPPADEDPRPHFARLARHGRPPRARRPLHGHERRLRGGDRLRRHPRPRRLGDLRRTRAGRPEPSQSFTFLARARRSTEATPARRMLRSDSDART